MTSLPRRRATSRACAAALGLVLGLVVATLTANRADARSAHPTPPAGVHVTSVGTSWASFSSSRVPNVQRYLVWVTSVKADLYVTNLGRSNSRRHGASSTSPSVTVRSLPYRAGGYFYRYGTRKGRYTRVSDIHTVSLRPVAPTSLSARTAHGVVSLRWRGPAATTYEVRQATNSALTRNAVRRSLRGTNFTYTPYGLTARRTYWFAVRAWNGGSPSAWSARVHVTPTAGTETLRIATYNLLYAGATGRIPGSEPYASWSKRRTPAARLVAKGSPDIVGMQEAVCTALNGSSVRTFQATQFVASLNSVSRGRSYTLAASEASSGRYCPARQYTNFIAYDRHKLTAATGPAGEPVVGHVTVGTCHGKNLYGVYQLLKTRSSGAHPFLVVSSHNCAGVSSAMDSVRRKQAESLITQTNRVAAAHGAPPVLYVGDFNSHYSTYHPYDGPGIAMRAHGMADAFYVTQARYAAQYNSFNSYRRTPPQQGASIDRVFAGAGIAMRSWSQLLTLSHGRFVGTIPSDHNPLVVSVDVPRG